MRTEVDLIMSGKSVGAELSKYLKTVSYREALDGEADTLEVTLQDVAGLFMSGWFPTRGTMIEAILENEYERMPLGDFYVDEIENSFPPSECKIKGTSIPPGSNVKAAEKWRSWQGVRLSDVGMDLATKAGLKFYYEGSYNPEFDRVEQSDESDLQFLHRLCETHGLALKLNDKQLIILDMEVYENKGAVKELEKGSSQIKRFSVRSTLNEIYTRCAVSYDSGDDIFPYAASMSEVGALSGLLGGGKVLQVNRRVRSDGEAIMLARKRLKAKNREETKMQMTLAGDFRLRAGATVRLSKFKVFDGKYLIQKATHTVGSGGYESTIELSRVN